MAFDSTQLDIVIAAKFLAGPAFEQAKAGMEGIRQAQERMAQGMAQANSSLGLMKTALQAIPFAAAFQQLSALHDGTVKLAASINDQAEALSLSTRYFQALQIAAQGAGLAESQVSGIITTFNARIGAAVQGKKEAIAAFDALGVKLLDSQGKLRGEGALLQEVAAKLVMITDASERTARAKELLGISGAKATAMLKDLALGYEGLAESGERAGLIMDQKTIDTLAKLDRQSTDLTRTIQVLYGQLAAPIITTAIEAVDTSFKKIKSTIDDLGKSWSALPDLLLQIFRAQITLGGSLLLPPMPSLSAVIGGGGGQVRGGLEARIRQLEQERADFANAPNFGPRSAPVTMIDREIADIRRQLAAGRAAARGDNIPWTPNVGAAQPMVKPPGGGGAGQRDVLGALEAESRQLQESYQRVMGFSASTTQEMRDQAELADRIAKRLASSLKDVPEGDPRRGQIVALIEQNERYRQGIELRQRAIKEADATEKRYGDGLREHTETMLKLNTALADGLISQDAYAGAVRAANDALQQQRDRVAEARGGFEGFYAGFSSAMRSYGRATTEFRTGAQFFEQSTQLMSDALINFARTGELSFGRLLGSFGDMLIQMGLKAAASSLFGGIGSLFGGGGDPNGNGGAGGLFSGLFSAIGGLFRAEGGRAEAGRPYIVGEREAELFVPDTSGTIFNRDQVAAMGGGGSMPPIVINQTFGDNIGGATRAELRQVGAMAVEAAKNAVYDAVRRGGSYSAAFRPA